MGHGPAAKFTHGGSATGVGRRLGPAGQLGLSGHMRSRDRAHGIVMVTAGGRDGTLGLALSAYAPGVSHVWPANDNIDLENYDEKDNNYTNNALSVGNNDEAPEGASAPP